MNTTQGASPDGPEKRQNTEQAAKYLLARLQNGDENAQFIALNDLGTVLIRASNELKLHIISSVENKASVETMSTDAENMEVRIECLQFAIREGLQMGKTGWIEGLLQHQWPNDDSIILETTLSGIGQHILSTKKIEQSVLEHAIQACQTEELYICLAYTEVIRACLMLNPVPSMKDQIESERARVESVLTVHLQNEREPKLKETIAFTIEDMNDYQVKPLTEEMILRQLLPDRSSSLLSAEDIAKIGTHIKEKGIPPTDYIEKHFRSGKKAVFLGVASYYTETLLSQLTEAIEILSKEASLTHLALMLPIGCESQIMEWAHSGGDAESFPRSPEAIKNENNYDPDPYWEVEALGDFLINTKNFVRHVFTMPVDPLTTPSEVTLDKEVRILQSIWEKNPNARVLVLTAGHAASKVNLNTGEHIYVSLSKEFEDTDITFASCLLTELRGNEPYSESLEQACKSSAIIKSFGVDIGDSPLGSLDWETYFSDTIVSPMANSWDGIICSVNPDDDWSEKSEKGPDPTTDIPLPSFDGSFIGSGRR